MYMYTLLVTICSQEKNILRIPTQVLTNYYYMNHNSNVYIIFLPDFIVFVTNGTIVPVNIVFQIQHFLQRMMKSFF